MKTIGSAGMSMKGCRMKPFLTSRTIFPCWRYTRIKSFLAPYFRRSLAGLFSTTYSKFRSPSSTDRSRMLRSTTSTTLAGHVIHILFGSGKKKMVRIETKFIITGMTNKHPEGNLAMNSFPHKTICIIDSSFPPASTISAGSSSYPFYASVCQRMRSGHKFIVERFIQLVSTITFCKKMVNPMIRGGTLCPQK